MEAPTLTGSDQVSSAHLTSLAVDVHNQEVSEVETVGPKLTRNNLAEGQNKNKMDPEPVLLAINPQFLTGSSPPLG